MRRTWFQPWEICIHQGRQTQRVLCWCILAVQVWECRGQLWLTGEGLLFTLRPRVYELLLRRQFWLLGCSAVSHFQRWNRVKGHVMDPRCCQSAPHPGKWKLISSSEHLCDDRSRKSLSFIIWLHFFISSGPWTKTCNFSEPHLPCLFDVENAFPVPPVGELGKWNGIMCISIPGIWWIVQDCKPCPLHGPSPVQLTNDQAGPDPCLTRGPTTSGPGGKRYLCRRASGSVEGKIKCTI